MINVIPAPQKVKLVSDTRLKIDSSAWIDAGENTDLAGAWLREGLGRFASIAIVADSADGPRISLRVGGVESDLPTTVGVRPDPGENDSEAHFISIHANGIEVVGVSSEAVFRGATTLLQLISQAASEGAADIATGTIVDAPRLAWRGLSFDTVRCFHSIKTVEHVIDLLALYKFNVLHFHLTDTEGWRFQVDNWPLLTEVSGMTARDDRPGGYYTTEEFAEIVQYADDRFVKVVPEFDAPGHTASVIAAYPELASEVIREMDPAMQYLHPDQEQVPALIRDVYSAMAAQTNGCWVHIGGDEAIAMDHETFQRYIQLALPLARSSGKGIVAWQEAARGGLAEGDLVQWWIPSFLIENIKRRAENPTPEERELAENNPVIKAFVELFKTADQDIPLAISQGAKVILSPATQLYLDTKYVESSVDPAQSAIHERVGMPTDIYGSGTVQDSYNWDPFMIDPDIAMDCIAGVEAAIWCETIENPDDLFFQLLPRLAGVGEKAWSDQREWEDHRARLASQPLFWDTMGLTYFKSSVVW